jgi:Helix-turn-helix
VAATPLQRAARDRTRMALYSPLSCFETIRLRDQIACRRFHWPGGPCKISQIFGNARARRDAEDARISQQPMARKLGRPQSFIAKYEGGERRIDVIEFIEIARALGADPVKLFRNFVSETASSRTKRKMPER